MTDQFDPVLQERLLARSQVSPRDVEALRLFARTLPAKSRSRGIYHFINRRTRNFACLPAQSIKPERRTTRTPARQSSLRSKR